jgi:hypothetical protein
MRTPSVAEGAAMAKGDLTKDEWPRRARKARLEPRRRIEWESFDASGVDPAARALAARSWAARMQQEHLAVSAFGMLVTELAAEECDPLVLSMLAQASADEVRHAQTCRSMAVALLGEDRVPVRLRGVPTIPKHPRENARTRSLLHVVEMCCLGETLTGVYLTQMHGLMEPGPARQAVASLLEDEIDHGRAGWLLLAARSEQRRLDGLAAALPAMLDRTIGPVVDAGKRATDPGGRALESVGYLCAAAAASIYVHALREVLLPGFEACGIDLGPTRAHMATRGWRS